VDRWDGGADYEHSMGRWSRFVAAEFVKGLGNDSGLQWLDVGCGTGALLEAVLESAAPAGVAGVDPIR
jgi:ubiquinone/menaquinone biosynthesis C-methylase UbiE